MEEVSARYLVGMEAEKELFLLRKGFLGEGYVYKIVWGKNGRKEKAREKDMGEEA